MAQLVGSVCVLCQRRIGSILEGHFCRACSQSIHEACLKPKGLAQSAGHCTECGSPVVATRVPNDHNGPEKGRSLSTWELFGQVFRAGHAVQLLIVGIFTLVLGVFLLFHPDFRGAGTLRDMMPGALTLLVSAISFGTAIFLVRRAIGLRGGLTVFGAAIFFCTVVFLFRLLLIKN